MGTVCGLPQTAFRGGTMMEREAIPPSDTLLAAQAAALLRQQATLQTEAAALLAQCDLVEHLRRVGHPELIGSAALGLMVWRDIDLLVVAPGLRVAAAFAALSPLITDPRVTQMRYLNQSGPFNETGLPEDERYYVATLLRTAEEAEWKIDISFWLADRSRRELAYLDTTRQHLFDETRVAILWIKEMWHRRPSYRTDVLSIDIYDAVLAHGVRTPRAFERYLRERGKPTS